MPRYARARYERSYDVALPAHDDAAAFTRYVIASVATTRCYYASRRYC